MSGALKLRQKRSRERRARIVAAATRLFGRQGISQTSLTEVARGAGIPLPSLYDYFKDKQDLVAAVPEANYLALYRQVTENAALGERRSRARLKAMYLANFEYVRRNPDWGRVFFLEIWPSAALAHARIRKSVDGYARRYIEMIEEAVEAGDYRKELDPYLAMSSLMGGMCHLAAVWLLYRRPFDLVQRGVEMFDLLERSFLCEDAVPKGPRRETVR